MMPLLLPSAPGRMSLTKTVPSTVPSLFHNSDPWVASEAEKKTVSPNAVRFSGLLPFELCVFQMSFTSSGDGAAPADTKPRRLTRMAPMCSTCDLIIHCSAVWGWLPKQAELEPDKTGLEFVRFRAEGMRV